MLPGNAALYPCDPATGVVSGTPPNGAVLDGYLATLSPAGQLLHSTYVGGAGHDDIRDVEVRADGAFAYVVGITNSAGKGSACAPQPTLSLGRDAFQATIALAPAGGGFSSSLAFWTYLGGGADDFAHAMAYDANTGSVFAAGYTTHNSSTIPFPTTANALQPAPAGSSLLPYDNGFLTQIAKPTSCSPDLVVRKFGDPEPAIAGCALTYTIEVENTGVTPASQVVMTDHLPSVVTLTSSASSQGTCTGTGPVVCELGTLAAGEIATVTLVGTISPAYSPTQPPLVNVATATSLEADADPSDNAASWTTHVLIDNPGFTVGAPSVAEGNDGTTTAVFDVALTGAACSALPFTFTTAMVADPDVAAQPTQDFVAASGSFSIPAGETSYQIPVTILGDMLVEPDELFDLVVTANFTGPVIGATATGTIVNDDAPPVVTLAGPQAADEGSSQAYSFVVASNGPFTVSSAACGAGTLTGAVSTVQNPGGGGSGSFTCAFGNGPAATQVTVQVEGNGAPSNVGAVDVSIANLAPAVVLTGLESVESGGLASYGFTVTDPGGDAFVLGAASPGCGINGTLVAGSLVVNPAGGSFQCQFTTGPATSEVAVQVTDADGAGSNVATLLVDIAAAVAQAGKVIGNGNAPGAGGSAHFVAALTCGGDGPANFQVSIGKLRFKLEQLEGAACVGDPFVDPDGVLVPFSTIVGTGMGKFQNAPGFHVSFTLVDGMASNGADSAEIVVTDPQGTVVLSVSGALTKGKIQAQAQQ
jgi:uncharacterized repeat protein (TIGR01451 family)